MRRPIAVFSLAYALGAAGFAYGQQEPGSNSAGTAASQCRECGVISSIRELQREREAARTLTEGLPPVGPMFSFSFGGEAPAKHVFVGAVGNREMRDSLVEISYEVTVRFNDGRYGVVETRNGADLRVGDPVKVVNNKIELNV
ncbi:MAG TPA: hypothetical protein VJT81_04050 [Burkholderiales bacterium]|nr:hypothetical protein [Burkholderiales bacterium]